MTSLEKTLRGVPKSIKTLALNCPEGQDPLAHALFVMETWAKEDRHEDARYYADKVKALRAP